MTREFDRRLIAEAKAALRRGNRTLARRKAQEFLELHPDDVDGWLLLGGLSTPKASLDYLLKAQALAPDDFRVKKAMSWAQSRLQVDSRSDDLERTRKIKSISTFPEKQVGPPVPVYTRQRIWVWVGVVMLVLLLVFLSLDFIPSQIVQAIENARPISHENFSKPSLSPTATNTPTKTATPTITLTLTPMPTSTPTVTAIPTQTQPSYFARDIEENERWIDIDLSEQRLYAYAGQMLVKSFVVSTGTYLHPTPVGQFAVWIKLRYDDMRGPGYFLPDVPYTMYFYQGYGIHGTYWHSNFGTPMSHGCVNMITEEAGWLFNWSHVGILVNVHE